MNLSMVKQAMELRSKLERAQKELAKMTVEAEAGKGAVKVTADGRQKILSIKIAPEAVNPKDVGQLEKLVLKAVTEASEKSKQMAEQHLKQITGGLKIPGMTD
jgi:DNA-binding YbaB/EbfC family protein